jgi:hypothetical protein
MLIDTLVFLEVIMHIKKKEARSNKEEEDHFPFPAGTDDADESEISPE